MAQIDEKLRIEIEAENKVKKGMDDARKSVADFSENASNDFKKLDKNIEGISNNIAMSIAAAFSIRAITNLGKTILNLGADSVETANLFAVSFGSMTMEMNEFGRELQSVSGISDTLYRDQSARINNLFKTLGIANEQSMMMTQDLMERALDISSLFNVDREVMFDKLRAGLVGMIKPLRDYGINLEIANVQNYAYANGIAEAGTELTQSQKTFARYLMILESTKQAQGDMARTIDTAGNASRKLKDMMTQLGTTLGLIVLPILTGVYNILIPIAKGMQFVSATILEISQFIDKLREMHPLLDGLIGLIGIFTTTLMGFAVATAISKLQIWGKIKAIVTLNGALTITNGKLVITKALTSALFIKVTLLVSAIYLLYKAFSLIFGNKKQENSMNDASVSANDFKDSINDSTDSIKDMAKEQKKLTPLDEILNIGDSATGTATQSFSIGGVDEGIPESIDAMTDNLLEFKGLFGTIIEQFKEGNKWVIAIGGAIGIAFGAVALSKLAVFGAGIAKLIGVSALSGAGLLGVHFILAAIAGMSFAAILNNVSKLTREMDKLHASTKRANDMANQLNGTNQELTNAVLEKGYAKDIQNTIATNQRWLTESLKTRDKLQKQYDNMNFIERMISGGEIKKLIDAESKLISQYSKSISQLGGKANFTIGSGRFANGGEPPRNRVSIVGERGPELFVPSTRGMVVSNDDIKRSLAGNNNNNNQELLSAINNLSNSQQPVILKIDGRELARTTYNRFEEEGNRNGKDLKIRSVG